MSSQAGSEFRGDGENWQNGNKETKKVWLKYVTKKWDNLLVAPSSNKVHDQIISLLLTPPTHPNPHTKKTSEKKVSFDNFTPHKTLIIVETMDCTVQYHLSPNVFINWIAATFIHWDSRRHKTLLTQLLSEQNNEVVKSLEKRQEVELDGKWHVKALFRVSKQWMVRPLAFT